MKLLSLAQSVFFLTPSRIYQYPMKDHNFETLMSKLSLLIIFHEKRYLRKQNPFHGKLQSCMRKKVTPLNLIKTSSNIPIMTVCTWKASACKYSNTVWRRVFHIKKMAQRPSKLFKIRLRDEWSKSSCIVHLIERKFGNRSRRLRFRTKP